MYVSNINWTQLISSDNEYPDNVCLIWKYRRGAAWAGLKLTHTHESDWCCPFYQDKFGQSLCLRRFPLYWHREMSKNMIIYDNYVKKRRIQLSRFLFHVQKATQNDSNKKLSFLSFKIQSFYLTSYKDVILCEILKTVRLKSFNSHLEVVVFFVSSIKA